MTKIVRGCMSVEDLSVGSALYGRRWRDAMRHAAAVHSGALVLRINM